MRHYRALVIFIFIIIVGIAISPFGFLKPVKSEAFIIFSPVTRTFQRIGIGANNFFHTLFSLGNIVRENDSLKKKTIQLQADNLKLKEVQHENDLLKRELQFINTTKLQLIPANIIAKSPNGFMDSFIINRGSNDGIKDSQAVVSQGYLIGLTHNVTKKTAEVLLITSNASKIPAYLQDSRGTGVVQGGLQGLSLEDVQLDIMPKKGEAVLSSDIGNILPRGIPIGTVKDVSSADSDISHSATLTSPIAASHLEMVFVVK